MGQKNMKGVQVTYNDGGTKFYACTGYQLKNFNFKDGKALALYLFKGKGQKAMKLRKAKIKTWKVVYY